MSQIPKERFLATRASLLGRLANWQDHASWSQFFDLYWRLLWSVAVKSGLSETEADEAVQETILSVAHGIERFQYDPTRGSFKSWLLKIARNKIVDQFRRRDSHAQIEDETAGSLEKDTFGEVWDEEWKRNLLDAGMSVLKSQIEPLQFQIFDCYVIKGWEPGAVARTLGISIGQVYLTKNRLSPRLRKIIERLERDGI